MADDVLAPARGWSASELLIAGAVCVLALGFAATGRGELARRAASTACQSQLRSLALAAINYSDDKRFFPHVNRLQQYHGDETTGDTSKVFRALLFYGYLEDPSLLVCPGSPTDRAHAISAAVREDSRRWFWGGQERPFDPASSPYDLGNSPYTDGAPDPALRDNRELTYQWTRRGYNR